MLTGDMMSSSYMSAPTLFYPPPPSTEYFPATGARCVNYSSSPEPRRSMFSRPVAPPPTSQRNRKRSRDQTEDDERAAALHAETVMDTSAIETEPEPIYGEGMVLINPRTGQPIGQSGSSGTGTWHEERAEEEKVAETAAQEQARRDEDEMARAINRPVKASRLDLAGTGASSDRSGSPSTTPGLIAPAPLTPATPASPVVDQAAIMLGVGWRQIEGSDDAALASASRGWARYIDNHFTGLAGTEILAKSAGKEAFFVKARDGNASGAEGFFLFSDSLEQGQLLAQDLPTAVANLQSGSFTGQLMSARQSASPEPAQLPTPSTEVSMEM